MKKVVYTLALDGYPSEMTILTFPWIKRYAEKIGAEFQIIHERKNPAWPPTYEKTQIPPKAAFWWETDTFWGK